MSVSLLGKDGRGRWATYREMIVSGSVPVEPSRDGETKPDRGSWFSVCKTDP